MLTKTDLNQIRGVVHEEVNVIIDEKLKLELEPIKNGLTDLKSSVTDMKKDVKYLKKKVNRIDKTVNLIVRNYDEADVKLHRRVKKIEDHIGLTL